MANREKMLQALRNASEAADAGDETAAADARRIATMLKNMPADQSQERGAFDRFARGFGSAIADTAGVIPGAAMELGNLTGLTDFEDTSGANLLRRQGQELGVTNAPGQRAEGAAGVAGEALGIGGTMGAGLMGALGRTAPLVQQATRTGSGALRGLPSASQTAARSATAIPEGTLSGNLRQIGQVMAQPAAARPGLTGSAELAAGAGAGAAGQAARDSYGDESWVAPVAEVLAGGAVGAAPGAVNAGAKAGYNALSDNWMGQSVKAVRRMVGLGGNTGGNLRASESLAGSASDPVQARLRLLGRTGESGDDAVMEELLTAAQQTGDSGIMSLAAKVRADDPRALEEWRTASNRAFSVIRDQVRAATDTEGADPTEAVATLNRIKDDAIQAMEDSATLATSNAASRIQQLGPDVPPEQASGIVRRELEAAKNQSRGVQTALWNAPDLPKDAVVVPTGFRQWYQDSLAGMNDADIANVLPASARRFFNKAVPEEPEVPQILDARGNPMRTAPEEPEVLPSTFGELQTIRSEMLSNARSLRGGANPDLNRARLLEEAADSITSDFQDGMTGLTPEGRGAFDRARDYTARYNRRFRQGAVGELLRRTSNGANAVPDDATLTELLKGKPILRGIRERDLTTAVGNNPQVWGAVDDFMRHEFAQTAIRDGQLNRAAADSFMRQNDAVFRNRPNLRQVFDNIISGEESAARLQLQSSELAKRLNDPKVSRAEVFLSKAGEGSVEEGVSKIFSTTDSDRVTREIVSGLRADESGEALRGFKAAVNDELLSRATRRSDQLAGNEGSGDYLSGSYLRQVLGLGQDQGTAETNRIRRSLEALYDTEELAQLRRLANTAFQLERDIAANPASEVSGDFTGKLMEFMSSYAGARAGGMLSQATGAGSGANLVIAGRGAGLVRGLVQRGVNDPARRAIIDALSNKELMDTLLAGVKGEQLTPNHRRTLANWIEGMGPVLSEEDRQPQQPTAPTPQQPAPTQPQAPAATLPQAPPIPRPSSTSAPAGGGFQDIYNQVRGR